MTFPQDWKTWEVRVSELIARAWLDESLYERLVHNPLGTLREEGFEIADFVEVQVNQHPGAVPVLRGTEGETVIYELPLPPKPDDLNIDQLRLLQETFGAIPKSC